MHDDRRATSVADGDVVTGVLIIQSSWVRMRDRAREFSGTGSLASSRGVQLKTRK